MNKVKVTSDGTCGGTKIFVDDMELTNVVSFEVRGTLGAAHTVDVRMYLDELVIDAPAEVVRTGKPAE